jgi:hypothetical protein
VLDQAVIEVLRAALREYGYVEKEKRRGRIPVPSD